MDMKYAASVNWEITSKYYGHLQRKKEKGKRKKNFKIDVAILMV